MNKFVLSALALTSASGLAFAGSETEEWLSLDREIESLASSLAPQSGGAAVSGFIKTSYSNSSDVTVGANDLGGFSLDHARLNFSGSVGDYTLFVSVDSSPAATGFGYFGATEAAGALGVLDAFVSWAITDQITGTMGNFNAPVLNSSSLTENRLLFIDRSLNGDLNDSRDLGLMLSGVFDQLSWWVSIQNGLDAAGDDNAFNIRVAFDAMGDGSGQNVEGAWGAGDGTNLTIAAAYFLDDDTVDDFSAAFFEAYFTSGALSASVEVVAYDDGVLIVTPAGAEAGPTMWAATVSYMFAADAWEGALRFEDLDDAADTTIIIVGVNRYIEGHDAKWQLNYSTIESDTSAAEVDVIAIALVVSV